MKPLFQLCGLISYCLLLSASVTGAELKKQSFQVTGGDQFLIELPPGWKVDTQISPGAIVDTVRMVSTEGTAILMVSVMPSTLTSVESLAELEQILVATSRRQALDSREQRVQSLSFSSPHALGVYATFTDSRYARAEPAKGEFRSSTTFILTSARRVVTATFLSNEQGADALELAILILKTLRRESAPA